MTTLETGSVDDCINPSGNETDFSDPGNTGDWDGIDPITNQDNMITNESIYQAQSINETYRKECWECAQCNTINNIRECIRLHGSKCVGCKTECYIESQTPTIMRSEFQSNDELYKLQTGDAWRCESCLVINDKSIPNCTICENPSKMTILRRKIKKFTKEEKALHLVHGFVREHDIYLEIKECSIYSDLFQLIHKFYVIDYLEAGWIIGNVKCMSIIKASNLKVGDKLDHRYGGKFEAAKVKEIRSTSGQYKFKLEYEGIPYESILASWNDYNEDPLNFAEAGAVSGRPAHRLTDIKRYDKVDINPIYTYTHTYTPDDNDILDPFFGPAISFSSTGPRNHGGWKNGWITQMDSKSGQVEVRYRYEGKIYTHWTHLDNQDEIAEHGMMTSNIGKTMADLLKDDIEKKRRAKGNLGDAW